MTIEVEVRRHAYRAAVIPTIDLDDLRSLARIAVLEAVILYHPGRGAQFTTWAQKIIRWRLDEVCERESVHDPLPPDDQLHNGKTPHELLEELEARMWVETAIGRLPVRQRTIIAAKMGGESHRSIAPTLGIGRSMVSREARAAVCTLRRRALLHGLRVR